MKIVELKLKEGNTGEGVTAISLVKHPAIEQNWVAFGEGQEIISADNQKFAFKTIDEDQHIVAGPAMIPDKLMYRIDPEGEESFVFFTADTIRQLSERFLTQGRQNNMTLEHEATLNDLSLVESWIVEDPEKDKSSLYDFDLPKGSWFVKIKVINDDVWNLVKEGSVEGFSVEGVFARELIKQSKPMKKTTLDSYLDKIKNLFNEEVVTPPVPEKFAEVTVKDIDGNEIVISYEGDALEVGAAITHIVEDEAVAVPTGEYTLEDGSILIVAEDGVVGELKPKPEEEPEEESAEEGLKQEQLDALVNGLAEIIANFRTEVLEKFTADIKTAIADSETSLREEFNKPAVTPPVPEKPEDKFKENTHRGLSRYVKESGKE